MWSWRRPARFVGSLSIGLTTDQEAARPAGTRNRPRQATPDRLTGGLWIAELWVGAQVGRTRRISGPAGEWQPEILRGYRTGAPVASRAGHPVQRHPHRPLPELQRPPGHFHCAGQRGGPASADARRTPPPTKEDRDLANAFEAHVERVAALLRSGIHENQIVAVRKTSPHRAGTLADLLAVMQTDLRRIEVALREVAIQASFLDQAA